MSDEESAVAARKVAKLAVPRVGWVTAGPDPSLSRLIVDERAGEVLGVSDHLRHLVVAQPPTSAVRQPA
jgi:hypothetical protein